MPGPMVTHHQTPKEEIRFPKQVTRLSKDDLHPSVCFHGVKSPEILCLPALEKPRLQLSVNQYRQFHFCMNRPVRNVCNRNMSHLHGMGNEVPLEVSVESFMMIASQMILIK
jgi:hypothetical protein